MLKTETVIDIKLETVIPINSAKVIITVTLYAIRFLNSLSYSFFFVTNIYIYLYILFTANAAKEAMLPYFPQIVEFIKVITALPVDSDVK